MELRIYILRKLTFTGNQTFYENFILRKFGAIWYVVVMVLVLFKLQIVHRYVHSYRIH